MAKEPAAPEQGLKRSTFFEAVSSRGLEQMLRVYDNLFDQARAVLPDRHPSPGSIVGIDGSPISATLSMDWADKARIRLGFDANHAFHPNFV